MGKPKKRTSAQRTRRRRENIFRKLAKRVNGKSPVKVTFGKPKAKASEVAKPAAQKAEKKAA